MKKLILTACIAAIAGAANAQFGIELGLNMANMKFKSDAGDASTSMKIGARVGGIYDIGISDNFYLQPGLFFAMNGTKQDDITYSVNTIEIPINVIYKFGEEGGNRFFVGAGPYIGYNVSGKVKSGSNSESLHIGSDKDKDDLKPLDFGIGVNVGYELGMGLFFRARYQAGLANLSPSTDGGMSAKSSSFGVSVGYFFGKGSKGGGKK